MDTKETTRERISALADGELSAGQMESALAALRQPQALADWEIYHQIGDLLRSDDMAVNMSPDFASRMAARLEQEPAIVAPVVVRKSNAAKTVVKRWAVPGMVAAAVAAVAFVGAQPLMVALNGGTGSPAPAVLASSGVPAAQVSTVAAATPVVTATVPEGVVLRDPRIDDYLLAHQRFSPSVFSSAQYARSATFAADSNK